MRRLATGQLEAAVMDVLWDAGGWLSPSDVNRGLGDERKLAYTTIMTVLVRLWKKGRLERRKDGRSFTYRPLESREENAARRMRDVLVNVNDRPAALAGFVDALRPEDREGLQEALLRLNDPTED